MKTILIITKKPLHKSPRVLKQITALKSNYEISTIGLTPSGEEEHYYSYDKLRKVKHILRLPLLKLRMFNKYYWDKNKINLVNKLSHYEYDAIIAHNEEMLPLAIEISNKSKIILDAHEYTPDADGTFLWRFFLKNYSEYLCDTYLNKSDAMITVSDGISKLYCEKYGVESYVIKNSTNYFDLSPSKIEGTVKLIHHGFAHPGRKIELMIETMKYLGNGYSLDLMLDNRLNKRHYKKIERKAQKLHNVNLVDPVPFEEIVYRINKYDIGIYILKPFCLSAKYALPNKMFEFVQARLAIAIAPAAEMGKIVDSLNLGVVAKDYSPKSMAKAISGLSKEKIMHYKEQAHKHAWELSSQKGIKQIRTIVDNMLAESTTSDV
jgi:hypothetical protein